MHAAALTHNALRMTTTCRQSPSRVSQQATRRRFDHARRFETRNERRLWSTGIKPFTLHDVGIIQAARFDANSHLSRLRFRIRQLDQLELVHTSKTFYANCFHVAQDSSKFSHLAANRVLRAMRSHYSASRAMPRK